MPGAKASSSYRLRLAISFAALLAAPLGLSAQQTEPAAQQAPASGASQTPAPSQLPDHPQPNEPGAKPSAHRFWDAENDSLFAGVLGARFLDFASTLNARRRGLNEELLNNDIVDNHPAFAAIEFAGAAASVGVSYLFHRAGHHRLERWTSYIHIGVTVFGAARNYALKTPHPAMMTGP